MRSASAGFSISYTLYLRIEIVPHDIRPSVTLTLDKTQSFQTKAEAERAGFDVAISMIDSYDNALGTRSWATG